MYFWGILFATIHDFIVANLNTWWYLIVRPWLCNACLHLGKHQNLIMLFMTLWIELMEDLQGIHNHNDGHHVNQIHNHQIDINYESTPKCIVRISRSSCHGFALYDKFKQTFN
jgi:hypothetical protein